MAPAARVRTLVAVLAVLLLAVVLLTGTTGIGARVAQVGLVLAMAAVVGLIAAAG